MLVLGFDTATEVTTIALASENKVLADLALVSEKTQMERLMPLIDMILDQAGVKLSKLDGIAVGLGPGLFTSLRIGVTTAKTLAQALDVPIVSIPTLDVLAYSFAHSTSFVCSVIDAKRGEVFTSLYQALEGDISEVWPPKVVSPQALTQELSPLERPVILVGNGAWAYQALLREKLPQGAEVASAIFVYPRASNLISLAFPRFISGEVDDANKLAPIYLRKSDAEIAHERKKLK